MRFWISWYQPTEDKRPVTYPPNKSVLGWWCSGQRSSDDAWTIVAWVSADSEEDAEKAVREDWPEAVEFRFCEARDADWRPNDRFPLEDWMVSRCETCPV